MNNALCRALLVILQSTSPAGGNIFCSGSHSVTTAYPGIQTALPVGTTETIRLDEDGAYVITVSRLGGTRTDTRVAPGDKGYEDIRAQMGDLKTGDTIQIAP